MVMAKRRKQSEHLPFHLVEEEILLRLSVRHLVQLCCVCKSWNYLISRDSDFAQKHFRLSTSRDDRHHLILSSRKLVLSHSPVSSIFSSIVTTTTAPVKPFRYSRRNILNKVAFPSRVSTCDGILCFKKHNTEALVCNPFIGKSKKLPLLKYPGQEFILYTLVYHGFTNSYKVIAIDHLSIPIKVNVHTLGTSYWTKIQDFPGPYLMPTPRTGIFVNDSVNWLTYDSTSKVSYIVSLDLEKESYQKLSPPPVIDMDFDISVRTTLGTLKGCLSLLSPRDKFYDVWIMKEYGNEKSWTKLLSVPHMEPWGICHYTKVLYISKDDQVLMEFHKDEADFNLVVYDSIKNTFKIPEFQNNIHGQVVTQNIYVESLISPL